MYLRKRIFLFFYSSIESIFKYNQFQTSEIEVYRMLLKTIPKRFKVVLFYGTLKNFKLNHILIEKLSLDLKRYN